jgi:peptidyl-prolyl cis-trans isomerase C
MKFLVFSTLACAVIWAQSAPAPGPSATGAQSAPKSSEQSAPAASITPDTVVATFGQGQKVTLGELTGFLNSLPPQMQQSALHNRKEFVQQFALMHKLAEMAEEAHLDQTSPTKDNLRFNRMYLLMNAELHTVMEGITVPVEESKAYYEKNKDHFSQVKVKALYVAFAAEGASAADGKKRLTEPEAEAKVGKLRAQIVTGADFVKLVKENSDDPTSAAKDGDFGVIKHGDKLPDAIREAVFSLKAGEVSAAVKQPNGFYLFRAEEITPEPYNDVQSDIVDELRQIRFKAWMDDIVRGLNLKYDTASLAGHPAPSAGK